MSNSTSACRARSTARRSTTEPAASPRTRTCGRGSRSSGPPEILDTLPLDGSVGTNDEAIERCGLDAGYTGSYAAVHPEEDFAETFSAYVYDVEVDEALAPKLAFFDRYPEFVSIRDNARELGVAGVDADFDGCG